MTTLICVAGSAPGIGKSTLCEHIAAWAVSRGQDMHQFHEEDILTCAAFAPVARQFRAIGRVAPRTIVDCTAAWVGSIADADVIVADALLPYTASLLAWGHSEPEVRDFLARLVAVLAPWDVVVVYLVGDPALALPRAAEREGPGWLEGYLSKLAGRGVTDLASGCAYLRRESELTRRLLLDTGWRLVTVDADAGRPEQAVLARL